MKRAKSMLIDSFLFHIKKEYITGLENSSGPLVLERIVDALQDILNGEDPDKALQIKRGAGNPAKEERNLTIAKIMRAFEKAGEKKTAGYAEVNTWLKATGKNTLSKRSIGKIFEEYRPQVEVLEATAEIIEMTQKALPEQKKVE
jgi:hypothetical protein